MPPTITVSALPCRRRPDECGRRAVSFQPALLSRQPLHHLRVHPSDDLSECAVWLLVRPHRGQVDQRVIC